MTNPIPESVIAVWKPKGISSFRVVAILRKKTGIKKIGHAGTLDPLAEGVLVVGVGREGTKQLSSIVVKEKEYQATIKLGETSTTGDDEGEKTTIQISRSPTLREIRQVVKGLIGEIEQAPPIWSAIKISGQPAYKLARRGKINALPKRPVLVKSIKITNYAWPLLKLEIVTGPGVYIRSLARDIGEKLKTGGWLRELTRTRVGPFTRSSCIALDLPDDKIENHQES